MAKIVKSSIPYAGPNTENLIEFIKNGLTSNCDQIIFIDSKSDRKWTGRAAASMVLSIANYLLDECHLKKGDVCTYYGPSNDHSVLLILAVISAGGVVNFLTSSYKPREVLDTSTTLNAKFLLSSHENLERARAELSPIDDKISVISCDKQCEGFKNGCKSISELLSQDPSKLKPKRSFDQLMDCNKIVPDLDFGVIQFSSGTTGKPKPIPRTHKNLCHLVASVHHSQLMNLKPGEIITGSLSLGHRPGIWALLACVHAGSTLVLWSNLSDVFDAMRVIEKYKVTVFSSSLPFLAQFGNVGIKNKDKYDLKSLQHVITSGSKIVHPDLPKNVVKEFGLKSLRQCFGMTESGWVFLIESALAEDNYLSVGHVALGSEVAVLDRDTLQPVEKEVRGELAIRGPQIFPGYLNASDPGVYNRSDFTEDGFFRTGDQVYYDSNDLFFVEGRYKEMLIFSNNGRYFPNEIETVLEEHPAVEAACVIKKGEFRGDVNTYDIARAFVTLQQGAKVTEKELLDFVGERSFEIELKAGIKFLDKFPKLENGKFNKSALKEMD